MTEPPGGDGTQNHDPDGAQSTVVVALVGEADASRADRVREKLMVEVSGHPGRVVEVDLGGVDFVDSSLLAVFLVAARDAAANGGALKLRNPSQRFAEILATTGLDKVFDVA